ncbi:MAG: HU family DNA-binding protein [Desulfobulbaceae bacterium]|jgi:DNA-binding protein HU-beta|nr:HU family DNA-binding protein [Desulfobulbaceae bacterium]
MNRGELIAAIAKKEHITAVKAGKALSAILEHISQRLENGERVTLSGFGAFRAVSRPAQKGRNPHTGEDLLIPARTLVRFRPGKALLAKVR